MIIDYKYSLPDLRLTLAGCGKVFLYADKKKNNNNKI